MRIPPIAAFAFALLSVAGLSAQSKEPVAKIVLPPEPVAQAVTKKVNVLDLFREGKAEMHINPKADIVDDPKNVFKFEPDGLFHVSGNGYGGITTNDSFKDYHLVIESRSKIQSIRSSDAISGYRIARSYIWNGIIW